MVTNCHIKLAVLYTFQKKKSSETEVFSIETQFSDGGFRAHLMQQVQMGRRTLLGTVALTAVNLLLLLSGQGEYLLFSVSVPYYLVWLGKGMDNYFAPSWTENGTLTWTGLVPAALILGAYMLVWLLSRKKGGALWVAFGMLCIDSAALIAVALLSAQGIGGTIVDILIHFVVLYQLAEGARASKRLAKQAPEQRYTVVQDGL